MASVDKDPILRGGAFHCSHGLTDFAFRRGLLPADGCHKPTPRTGTRMSADDTGRVYHACTVDGYRGGCDVGKAIVKASRYGNPPTTSAATGQGRTAGLIGAIVVLDTDRNAGGVVTYESLCERETRRDWMESIRPVLDHHACTPEPRSGQRCLPTWGSAYWTVIIFGISPILDNNPPALSRPVDHNLPCPRPPNVFP